MTSRTYFRSALSVVTSVKVWTGALVLVLGFCPIVHAQTMFDCHSIVKPSPRLACYDRLSPPIAKKSRMKRKQNNAAGGSYAEEDARMQKLFGSICRNC